MKLFFEKVNKLNRGFTLVETLVAISIFTVSILTLLSILAQGIANINYAKTKMTATYLAQEGIEYIRNMRDTFMLYDPDHSQNWVNFRNAISECGVPGTSKVCYFDDQNLDFSNPSMPMTGILIVPCGGGPCPTLLYDSGTGKYNYGSGVNSSFIRSIQVIYPGGPSNDIEVSSTVSWTQGSVSYSISFSENLFNWVE